MLKLIRRSSSSRWGGDRPLSMFRERYGAYINGQEVLPPDAQTFKVLAPATDEVLCEVAAGDDALMKQAVDVADETFKSGIWSRSDVRYRANVLNGIAASLRAAIPELLEMEVAQTGRAKREMKAQLGRLPEWFEYFGALIRTHEGTCPPFMGAYVNYVQRVPLGVCGLITPW